MATSAGTARTWDDWLREAILIIVITPTVIYYCGLGLIPTGPIVCGVGAVLGILTLIMLWPAARRLDGAAGRGLFTAFVLGATLAPIIMPGLEFLDT